jgi:Complex1_LYR-like
MKVSVGGLARHGTGLPPNLQVLPPIALYRRLLRAHRKYLPSAARKLGDEYVKAEFHRTRDVENPVHIIGFLTRWQVGPLKGGGMIVGVLSGGGGGALER